MSESTDETLESILANAIGWGWISVMDPERVRDEEQIQVTEEESVASLVAAQRALRALRTLADAKPPLDDNS